METVRSAFLRSLVVILLFCNLVSVTTVSADTLYNGDDDDEGTIINNQQDFYDFISGEKRKKSPGLIESLGAPHNSFTSFEHNIANASNSFNTGEFGTGKQDLKKAVDAFPALNNKEQQAAAALFSELFDDVSKRGLLDTKKREYLAQQWVSCTSSSAKVNGEEKIEASRALASIYMEQDEAAKAEQILLTVLRDLHKTKNGKHVRIDELVSNLAAIFEIHFRPLLAKQCWAYLVEYNKAYQPKKYFSSLMKYENFLVQNRMKQSAQIILNEIHELIEKPEFTRLLSPEDYCKLATLYYKSNEAESNRLFEKAFSIAVKQSQRERDDEYLSIAERWALMFNSHRRPLAAISVIKKALAQANSLSAKVCEENSAFLINKMLEQLRSPNMTPSTAEFVVWLEHQKTLNELHVLERRKAETDDTLAHSDRNPHQTIVVLLAKADEAFEGKHCEIAYKLTDRAVSIYETQSKQESDYDNFVYIRKKFEVCKTISDSTKLLWRLVKRKMKFGYKDPEFPDPRDQEWEHSSAFAAFPRNAHEELLYDERPSRIGERPQNEVALLQLLACAKETNNSGNMLFALWHLKVHYRERKEFDKLVATCEQMEKWRAVEGNLRRQILGLLETADACLSDNRIEESMTKLRASAKLAETATEKLPSDPYFRNRLQEIKEHFSVKAPNEEVKLLMLTLESRFKVDDKLSSKQVNTSRREKRFPLPGTSTKPQTKALTVTRRAPLTDPKLGDLIYELQSQTRKTPKPG